MKQTTRAEGGFGTFAGTTCREQFWAAMDLAAWDGIATNAVAGRAMDSGSGPGA
jgi:hypothetical protein